MSELQGKGEGAATTMAQWDAIVVGAGLAGLVCAQTLQRAGYRVQVLEKSRGLGGRCATRRVDGVAMDHGARFLQPQTPALQALVATWRDRGLLHPWQPQVWRLDKTATLAPEAAQPPYWVAPAGMATVGKALGEGLSIQRQRRVVAIAPAGDRWQITAQTPDGSGETTATSRCLILAIPAPQALALVAGCPGTAAMQTALATVRYAPCVTVMAEYGEDVFALDSPLSPHDPWMVWGHEATAFAWAGLDSSKRSAPSPRVVLQSSATFAHTWLDHPNLQPGGEALLHQAQTHLAPWLGQPQRWQVHRWRYALVQQAVAEPCLSISSPLPLVACGDWCGEQPLADGAIASGQAAAGAIAALLPHS